MTPTQLCCSQALSTDINEQVGPLMPNNLVTGRLKSLNIPEPQYRFIVVRMIDLTILVRSSYISQ